MHHRYRTRSQVFRHEVTVRHRINAIRRDCTELELTSHGLAIDVVWHPCQRPRAQRQHVGPCIAIGHASDVALEHLEVSQQMVRQQDRLCSL